MKQKQKQQQVGFKPYLIGLLILLGIPFSQAQTTGGTVVTADFESWISAGVEVKLFKKWSFELSEEIRLRKNSTTIDQYFTNVGAQFEPLKFLEVGLGFRFMQSNNEDGTYTPQYRFYADVAFKHKFKRFDFKYRLRYQFRNEIGPSTIDGDYFKNRFRLKATAAYNVKKIPLEPKLSVELFNQFEKYTLLEFDRLRFVASLSYDFKKYGKLTLFYGVEQEIFTAYPKTTSIVGLNYVYTIEIKKNKKKKDEK